MIEQKFKAYNVLLLCIPASIFFEINIVGRLFFPEVIFLFALPFLLLFYLKELDKYAIITTTLLIQWLLFQIFSDIYNESEFYDYSRGIAKIFFVLVNFLVIYLLYKDKLVVITVGISLGIILQYLISPNIYADGDFWKFGVGIPVTLLLILGLKSVNNWKVRVLFIICIGLVHSFMLFRSLAGICFLTAVIIFLRATSKHSTWRIFAIYFFSVIAITYSYSFFAQHGYLGQKIQERYVLQTGDYGSFIGGRHEIFSSIPAIFDSPPIGHGSWAKDVNGTYTTEMNDWLASHGYPIDEFSPEGLIPTHSYLFGAWVEAGFFGALFWLWIVWLCLSVLLHKSADVTNEPLEIFIALFTLWNIFFSPLGAESRLVVAFCIYFILICIKKSGAVTSRGEPYRS